MRTEIGHFAIETDDRRYEFIPSFKNIREICSPAEMPMFYARLFGAEIQAAYTESLAKSAMCRMYDAAALVMQMCCTNEDARRLTGFADYSTGKRVWRLGAMPIKQMLIIARSLINHGLVGVARDSDKSKQGDASDSIDVYNYVHLAIAHLGMTKEIAENMTKTEFDSIVDLKYPDKNKGKHPTAKQHDSAMDWLDQVNARRAAAKGAK